MNKKLLIAIIGMLVIIAGAYFYSVQEEEPVGIKIYDADGNLLYPKNSVMSIISPGNIKANEIRFEVSIRNTGDLDINMSEFNFVVYDSNNNYIVNLDNKFNFNTNYKDNVIGAGEQIILDSEYVETSQFEGENQPVQFWATIKGYSVRTNQFVSDTAIAELTFEPGQQKIIFTKDVVDINLDEYYRINGNTLILKSDTYYELSDFVLGDGMFLTVDKQQEASVLCIEVDGDANIKGTIDLSEKTIKYSDFLCGKKEIADLV
ncbi:MAG: hypothetical protein ACP5D2_03985, partial [Candidatus Nanoarchaeia archaeon]